MHYLSRIILHLFRPTKHPVHHLILPHQATCHAPLAFPIPASVHIPLKGTEECFFGIHCIYHSHMAYASESLVEYCEYVRFPDRSFHGLVGFRPRHGHSIHSLVRNAAFLPKVYHRVGTPCLPRRSSCVANNGIDTRATIIYRAFPCSNQTLCLFLYAAYLSATKAAISKCKA